LFNAKSFSFCDQAINKSVEPVQLGTVKSNKLSNGFRLLLSEYANEFNKINNRTGSLFRQKTKSKDLTDESDEGYPLICFDYVHQNASTAGLTNDWEFSSYLDYIEKRNGTLCNKKLAFDLLGIGREYFDIKHLSKIDESMIKKIM